jgi:hypothetical protein
MQLQVPTGKKWGQDRALVMTSQHTQITNKNAKRKQACTRGPKEQFFSNIFFISLLECWWFIDKNLWSWFCWLHNFFWCLCFVWNFYFAVVWLWYLFQRFHCSPAVKLTKMGRHSGGLVLLIRKSLSEFVQTVETKCEDILCSRSSKQLFGCEKDVLFVGL